LEIYDALLADLKPKRCLEWGAGWSTGYFPTQHPCVEKWISIEHDAGWYYGLRDRVPANVDLRHCIDDEYVFGIFDDELRFDFIMVDGRQRDKCMLAASLLLKPVTGRCLLHDTARQEYHKWFRVFDHAEELTEGLSAEENPHGNAGRGLYQFWNDSGGHDHNKVQLCLECDTLLFCPEDYIGGGSHYYVFQCPECKQGFSFGTYDFTLRPMDLSKWSPRPETEW